MNPFQREPAKRKRSSEFVEHVYDNIKPMDVGDYKMVDLLGRDAHAFRVTLRHVCIKRLLFSKFKTKVDTAGNMWIMRVA